jgi:ABC-type transport system substrate-binding protein
MQAQLRSVGIEVVPTFFPPAALFERDSPLNRGEFDLALLGFLLEPGGDAEFVHDLAACGVNASGYCQRLVTRDLDQARRILNPRQKARVLNRADVQLAKDVPAIPLHELLLVSARRTTVRGFVLSPLPYQLVDAESWWLER